MYWIESALSLRRFWHPKPHHHLPRVSPTAETYSSCAGTLQRGLLRERNTWLPAKHKGELSKCHLSACPAVQHLFSCTVYLGEVSVLHVYLGHAVQPRFPEFWGACVRLGQTVLEIYQHFWVLLMFFHLSSSHEHCADSLCQIFDFGRKSCCLTQNKLN